MQVQLNTPIFSSSGDNKGAWVKLAQAWKIPLDRDAMVSYRLATDGVRAFLGTLPFRAGVTPSLRAYDGATGQKVWEAQFPGGMKGYPVASNGVVVQAITSEGASYMVGLDVTTGKEKWRQEVDSSFIDSESIPGTFLDGTFYYGDGAYKVFGIDVTSGVVKYSHKTTFPFNFDFVAPTVAGDTLIFGTGYGTVFGTSKDLTQSWVQTFGKDKDPNQTAPNHVEGFGDTVIAYNNSVSQTNGVVWALDAKTGKQLWRVQTDRVYQVSRVDNVIAVLGFTTSHYPIIGLDQKTGAQLWRNEARDGFERTRLTNADGTLFSIGHHLEIVDTKTGKLIYDQEMPLGSSVPPVAAGGHIVAQFADGVYGFN